MMNNDKTNHTPFADVRSYSEQRAENEKNIPPFDPMPDTGELSRMLEDLCLIGDMDRTGNSTLQAQAQILNIMLARTIYRTFNARNAMGKPIKDYFDEERMMLALRIQKQCAETLRISGALDYMKAITPTPAPKISERTEL